jgi:hypothetical protein
MNNQTKNLLRSVIRHLVTALEILNNIEEKDYADIVKTAKTAEKDVKGVRDNVERGNLFMTIFFVREVIEAVLHGDE